MLEHKNKSILNIDKLIASNNASYVNYIAQE